MKYYIDENEVSLMDLEKRIKNTDLVPSRVSLLENIEEIFKKLMKQGIRNLADLRKELKTSSKVKVFSNSYQIDENYLTLLRREINSYFPKKYLLKELSWLSKNENKVLQSAGLDDTKKIFEILSQEKEFERIQNEYVIGESFLLKILNLFDLMRMQWTSPLAAKLFFESGYKTTDEIANAEEEEMYNSINEINDQKKYFKGKIGLRDVKRLINSAKYVV